MLSSWKSKSELKSKLLIKLEKDLEKLYSLAQELQDLSLPEVEIHLTGFQGMTQTQLGLLAKNCHELKASIEGKRQYPSGKLKGSLPRLEPIVEQHESEKLCSQSKRRFDPNRPRILDSEALRSLFGFPLESKVEAEKETEDSEQFIEIYDGKEVSMMTTKQKSQEQSPKVAENDTPQMESKK